MAWRFSTTLARSNCKPWNANELLQNNDLHMYLFMNKPCFRIDTNLSLHRFSDHPMRFETSTRISRPRWEPSSWRFCKLSALRCTSSSSPPMEKRVWLVNVSWTWSMIAICSTLRSEILEQALPSCKAFAFLDFIWWAREWRKEVYGQENTTVNRRNLIIALCRIFGITELLSGNLEIIMQSGT